MVQLHQQYQQQHHATTDEDHPPPRMPRHKTPPRSSRSSSMQQQQQQQRQYRSSQDQQEKQQHQQRQSQQHHHHHQQQQYHSQSQEVLQHLIETQQWSLVLQRLEKHPDEASMVLHATQEGDLPLHWACQYQPPLEVINALLQLHEAAIQIKTSQDGSLPLHLACKNGASGDVVARLLMSYPSATRTKDCQGQLPLHVAVLGGASEDVLLALLMVSPKAAMTKNPQGQTPIDLATSVAAKRAMKRAPLLLAVSKAATNKVTHDQEVKLREVVQVYQDRMATVKSKYEEERRRSMATEVQLRQELWQEKEKCNTLQEQVDQLQHHYQEAHERLQQQELLLEHIQGLISQHSRREERSHESNNHHRTNTNNQEHAEENMTTTTDMTRTRPTTPPPITAATTTRKPLTSQSSNQHRSTPHPVAVSSPPSPSSIDVATELPSRPQEQQHYQFHYQREEQEQRHNYHSDNNDNNKASPPSSPRPSAPYLGPIISVNSSPTSAYRESRQDLDDQARLAKLAMQHWIETCESGTTTAYMVPEDPDEEEENDDHNGHANGQHDYDEETRDPPPRQRGHTEDHGQSHPYSHQQPHGQQEHYDHGAAAPRPRLQSKSQEWDSHGYETVSMQSPPVIYSQSLLHRSKQQLQGQQQQKQKQEHTPQSKQKSGYKANGVGLAARVAAEHKQRRERGEAMTIRRPETNMSQRERYTSKAGAGKTGNPIRATARTATPPKQPPKAIYSTRQEEHLKARRSRALSHSPERPRRSANATTLLGHYSEEDEDPTILSRAEWM